MLIPGHTVSQRLRKLRQIPPELIPLGTSLDIQGYVKLLLTTYRCRRWLRSGRCHLLCRTSLHDRQDHPSQAPGQVCRRRRPRRGAPLSEGYEDDGRTVDHGARVLLGRISLYKSTTKTDQKAPETLLSFPFSLCFSASSIREKPCPLYISVNPCERRRYVIRNRPQSPSSTSPHLHSGRGPATSSPSKPCMGSSPRISICAVPWSVANPSSSPTACSASHPSYDGC